MEFQIRVEPLPDWLDARRWLGPGEWVLRDGCWSCALPRAAAADLAARLRGVGVGGGVPRVSVEPALDRLSVRRARTLDARRRRETTPGFLRAGARLDEEGRYSLTPEILALALARDARAAGHESVVDVGCGVGGNAIAFAREGLRVVAVERDGGRLELARHNARVYGVEGRIEFVRARASDTLVELGSDLLFVDPPWGVDWSRERTDPGSLPLWCLCWRLRRSFRALWAKLPPSFATEALPEQAYRAVFGEATGDRHRIKFLLARWQMQRVDRSDRPSEDTEIEPGC